MHMLVPTCTRLLSTPALRICETSTPIGSNRLSRCRRRNAFRAGIARPDHLLQLFVSAQEYPGVRSRKAHPNDRFLERGGEAKTREQESTRPSRRPPEATMNALHSLSSKFYAETPVNECYGDISPNRLSTTDYFNVVGTVLRWVGVSDFYLPHPILAVSVRDC